MSDAHDPPGMTLAEAYRVAVLITDTRPDLVLLAVGRFLPPDEVTPFTPWAVSVHSLTCGRKSVIRDAAEVDPAHRPATKSKPTPAAKPASVKPFPLSLFD